MPRRNRRHTDAANLTLADRIRELAALLAAGLLRLRNRPPLPADPGQHPAPEKPSENRPESP